MSRPKFNRSELDEHTRKYAELTQCAAALVPLFAVLDAVVAIQHHENNPEYSHAIPNTGEYSRVWFETHDRLSETFVKRVRACIDAGLQKT